MNNKILTIYNSIFKKSNLVGILEILNFDDLVFGWINNRTDISELDKKIRTASLRFTLKFSWWHFIYIFISITLCLNKLSSDFYNFPSFFILLVLMTFIGSICPNNVFNFGLPKYYNDYNVKNTNIYQLYEKEEHESISEESIKEFILRAHIVRIYLFFIGLSLSFFVFTTCVTYTISIKDLLHGNFNVLVLFWVLLKGFLYSLSTLSFYNFLLFSICPYLTIFTNTEKPRLEDSEFNKIMAMLLFFTFFPFIKDIANFFWLLIKLLFLLFFKHIFHLNLHF